MIEDEDMMGRGEERKRVQRIEDGRYDKWGVENRGDVRWIGNMGQDRWVDDSRPDSQQWPTTMYESVSVASFKITIGCCAPYLQETRDHTQQKGSHGHSYRDGRSTSVIPLSSLMNWCPLLPVLTISWTWNIMTMTQLFLRYHTNTHKISV
jgi:hypothetical protein